MINNLLDFYMKSHPVTLGVLAFLSLYMIAVNWIFFYRYFRVKSWMSIEEKSLESLLLGASKISESAYLSYFLKSATSLNKDLLEMAYLSATKEATKGMTFLSIVASTAPFIGLFGTVVSILDTFTHIGKTTGGMSIIASGIADALIATAAGILVAIFAYTFHQLLKRKSYETINYIRMQGESLLSNSEA
ncbi:MAG: MotA/TolQ/ExbB proton channel family protein [Epsilonproteobacteria bacterium]|nr:MotA/TolQ/ExbB proton channel family protein [Campylobacterota bacterium]